MVITLKTVFFEESSTGLSIEERKVQIRKILAENKPTIYASLTKPKFDFANSVAARESLATILHIPEKEVDFSVKEINDDITEVILEPISDLAKSIDLSNAVVKFTYINNRTNTNSKILQLGRLWVDVTP